MEIIHSDTGWRCLTAHSGDGQGIKCACGQFIAPKEWDEHVEPGFMKRFRVAELQRLQRVLAPILALRRSGRRRRMHHER